MATRKNTYKISLGNIIFGLIAGLAIGSLIPDKFNLLSILKMKKKNG